MGIDVIIKKECVSKSGRTPLFVHTYITAPFVLLQSV